MYIWVKYLIFKDYINKIVFFDKFVNEICNDYIVLF